jgi:hypothetical protein
LITCLSKIDIHLLKIIEEPARKDMLGREAMTSSNSNLVKAFPSGLQDDALRMLSALPDTPLSACSISVESFSVEIGDDTVCIPYRIHHDPALIDSGRLNPKQDELLACLLTRHHNGLVRETYLSRILNSKHEWVPPFVVQLVGEYVLEITQSIRDGIDHLDPGLYGIFLRQNPAFYRVTKARVASYWNCYYRAFPRKDYAGFQVLEFFDRFIRNSRA